MNNYIIDPSVFYWMNTLGNIQSVSSFIGGFLLIVAVVCAIGYVYNRSEVESGQYDDNKRYLAICKRWLAVTLPAGLIFTLLAIFIPNKNTSIEMLVARTATFDNVDWTVAQVKEIIDYITNALKGVM
mgnify:CR=1 FL=1